MIDLVDRSVLVAGLDFWNYPGERLVMQFRKAGRALNPVATFSPPPDCDDREPSEKAGPRLYYDARADTADASSTMHAKCVIVDDREVLITSANFTGRAQHDNVELGVLIRDAEFAARVSGQWHTLVTRGLFRGHGRAADTAG